MATNAQINALVKELNSIQASGKLFTMEFLKIWNHIIKKLDVGEEMEN